MNFSHPISNIDWQVNVHVSARGPRPNGRRRGRPWAAGTKIRLPLFISRIFHGHKSSDRRQRSGESTPFGCYGCVASRQFCGSPAGGGGVCYKERGGGERNHRGPAQIRTGDLILSGCLEKTGKVNKSSGGIKNNPTVLQYCRGAALCFC